MSAISPEDTSIMPAFGARLRAPDEDGAGVKLDTHDPDETRKYWAAKACGSVHSSAAPHTRESTVKSTRSGSAWGPSPHSPSSPRPPDFESSRSGPARVATYHDSSRRAQRPWGSIYPRPPSRRRRDGSSLRSSAAPGESRRPRLPFPERCLRSRLVLGRAPSHRRHRHRGGEGSLPGGAGALAGWQAAPGTETGGGRSRRESRDAVAHGA